MLIPSAISIGTDIVEISRFRSIQQGSLFFRRVFSERELSYCFRYPDPAPHLAATFAAKEAVLKTVSSTVPMNQVKIVRDETGAPHAELDGDSGYCIAVSMSHSSNTAVAVAVRYPSTVLEAEALVELVNNATRGILEGDTT